MGWGTVVVEGEGFADGFFGFWKVALVHLNDAQIAQGVDVHGLDQEDLAVLVFGFV